MVPGEAHLSATPNRPRRRHREARISTRRECLEPGDRRRPRVTLDSRPVLGPVLHAWTPTRSPIGRGSASPSNRRLAAGTEIDTGEYALNWLLGDISTAAMGETNGALITSLATYLDDNCPGEGFFLLAQSQGLLPSGSRGHREHRRESAPTTLLGWPGRTEGSPRSSSLRHRLGPPWHGRARLPGVKQVLQALNRRRHVSTAWPVVMASSSAGLGRR